MGPAVKVTKNLILRVEDETKCREVLRLYQHNRNSFDRFEPTRPDDFFTEEYHMMALHREYAAFLHGSFIRYYIYKKDDDRHIIGSVNFNFYMNGSLPFAEIGYKIDCIHQQNGYAYEACQAGMEVIVNDYNIHRIDARIHPDNVASIKLAKKLGFTYRYLEPQSAHVNGQYVDLMRYSILL